MLSLFKTLAAVAATVATTAMAQDPNPPLGGSDCRIARGGGFYFHQVVVRTLINYDDVCNRFKQELDRQDGCSGTIVTCERDINSPQLKTFWFETGLDCDAADVEFAISRSTDEAQPFCNVTD